MTFFSKRWHISASVDILFYHFSWLPLLVFLLLSGGQHIQDYFSAYVIVMTVNFVHRHFGLPYAYLDKTVFKKHKRKLLIFPIACVFLFFMSPIFLSSVNRAWGLPLLFTMGAIALFWNFFHTYMQKFGILRIYNRKASLSFIPPWVDWCFIFAWIPFLVLALFPKHQNLILEHAKSGQFIALKCLNLINLIEPFLFIPSLLFLFFGIFIFYYYEWKNSQFKNIPRLSMSLGILGVSGSFLFFDPFKVLLAFAFSHAIEYIVFVIGFQTRRYGEASLFSDFIRKPFLFYFLFILILAGTYTLFSFVVFPKILILGMSIKVWIFCWAIYESFIHFYLDGFLWKIRNTSINQYL